MHLSTKTFFEHFHKCAGLFKNKIVLEYIELNQKMFITESW